MSAREVAQNPSLAKRERTIMDALYKLGKASAAEILSNLPGQPNYSTVRAQLRVLEEKGHVRHEEDGVRYLYFPTVERDRAKHSALRHLVDTFFEGSAEKVMAALLGSGESRLSHEEIRRLSSLVKKAKKEGKQ